MNLEITIRINDCRIEIKYFLKTKQIVDVKMSPLINLSYNLVEFKLHQLYVYSPIRLSVFVIVRVKRLQDSYRFKAYTSGTRYYGKCVFFRSSSQVPISHLLYGFWSTRGTNREKNRLNEKVSIQVLSRIYDQG